MTLKKEPYIKRLFIDIETSPNIVYSWRTGFKINLTPDNIIQERKIIMASWKWQHKDKVINATWDKDQCDKKLVERMVKVLDEADEIVYQNGDRFDLPWIRTRAIFHNVIMRPTYKTFDTLKKIRGNFYFNSNRLDYVQKYLGGEGKLEHGGFSLWVRVMEGERKALKEMSAYCDKDITELEELYNKIAPYVVPNTHVGSLRGFDKHTCAHCGSFDLKLDKTSYTVLGTKRRQMKCKKPSCGRYTTISDTAYKNLQKELRRIKSD